MSLHNLKLVNVLFSGVLGTLIFFYSLPSNAETYEVEVENGTNPAHAGTWTVDVTYNPTTNKVTFKIISGTGSPGQNTWDNWTYTVTGTLKDDIVTFDGPSDKPKDKDGKEVEDPNAILNFVGTSLNRKTGELTIGSVDTFPIKSTKLVKPANQPKDGKKAESSIPKDKTLSFNSLTQTLSITGSTIVSLPDSVDSLLGSNVTYPNFSLTGFNSEANAYIFANQNLLDGITLSNTTTVFQTSTISALYYNVSKDLFYGVLFNNTFNSTGSPFIEYVSSVLEPTNPLYDPLARYYVEIKPEVNFYTLTQGFQMTNATGGTDGHFLATPVPEPTSTLSLFALGTLGAASTLKRKLKPSKPSEKETTKVS